MGVGLATAILIDATLVRGGAAAGDDAAARRAQLVPAALARVAAARQLGGSRGAGARASALSASRDATTVSRSRASSEAGVDRLGSPSAAARAGAFSCPLTSSTRRARGAERRERQRDALGRRLGRVADADGAAGRVERRVIREQRGRVSVGADAEQRDIEHDVAELALVGVRRGLRRRARPAPGATLRERRRASRARAAGWIARRPPARSARRRTRCAPAASRCPTPRAARSSAAASPPPDSARCAAPRCAYASIDGAGEQIRRVARRLFGVACA